MSRSTRCNPPVAVAAAYRERFRTEPSVVVIAPGRVNIIGEHTDYTGGFVLPVAIDRSVAVAAGPSGDKTITGCSLDCHQEETIAVGDYNPAHPRRWFRYVMGVLSELAAVGHTATGFRFTIGGNVPIGSGLSSSAAVETASLTAFESLWNFTLADRDAALLCQRAENNFVGVKCGIMDQYISRIGRADHAVLIDCRDLSVRHIPLRTPEYTWLVIDSRKRRGLVDSEYNLRREECEKGLADAIRAFPGRVIASLRDLSPADLPTLNRVCDPVVLRRIRHIVTENQRVMDAVAALEAGDIDAVGACLDGSHASLRDDFQVSCNELDSLVSILSEVPGVAGSRLTGAGFGGCVVALVREDAVNTVRETIESTYHPTDLPPDTHADIWPIRIADGAHRLN